MSKLTNICLAAAMAAGLAAPIPAMAADANTVVATVNGTDITLGHMIVLRDQLPAQYQTLADDVLFKGILDQLIQQTALSQSLGDEVSPFNALALENSRRAYLAGAAIDAVAEGAVSDEALQAAYDARFAGSEPATEYNAAHILVATEAEAAEIRAKIDGGADFAEMAKENSTDGSAAGGGDLGWFGVGMMVKPFEDAVLAMKTGEVAGPIETQFGWHLINLKETRIAEAPSLDEMREELSADLQQAAIQARIDELTEGAEITRADEGIDPAILRDQTLVQK